MTFPANSGISVSGSAASMSTATSFEIEELTGDKRTLKLTDRALPYREFKLVGKQRVETTYYAGNPVGTQQVLGSEEGQTTINGQWKDKFIGGTVGSTPATLGGDAVPSVYDLVTTVDDFRRKGQQVKVTWGRQIRVGVITEFSVNWVRQVDVEWTLTFAWASQGEGQFRVAPPTFSAGDAARQMGALSDVLAANAAKLGVINPPAQTPVNPLQQANNALAAIQKLVANAIAAPTEYVLATNGYITNIYSAVASLAAAANAGNATISKAIDAGQAALPAALYAFIQVQCQNVVDLIDARVSPYFYNVALPPPVPPGPELPPISSVSAGQMLAAETSARVMRKAARDQRYAAARSQARAEAQAAPAEMVTVFVARQDQDLRRVCVQFYGSQAPWRELAVYNGLSSSKLVAGQLVFVPARPPNTSATGIPPGVRA